MTPKMHPMFRTLVSTQELLSHLEDRDWAVIDCRFELSDPSYGARAWAAGHIPHALYADLDRDLSGPRSPKTGRHPLPQPATLAATLGRFGIDVSVQVVAYDQGPGAFAARLWWLLRWLGHERVAVLDGGFAAWQRAGLPVSTTQETRPQRRFAAAPGSVGLVSGAQVARALAAGEFARGEQLLVDARPADRFAGQNETIDPVAGHIPGARSHPIAGNSEPDGRFRAPQELRERWLQVLRGAAPAQLIAMCGSGVTACHNLLALEVAGLSGARLYAGSWSEWIRDPAHAVASGAQSAG
jgi:thiosulfate/3-mercaptopyruvate sulfurtransferase